MTTSKESELEHAVGKLFLRFAAAESHFSALIHWVLDPSSDYTTHSEVAKAVTGGLRMKPLRDTINRLLRVTEASDDRIEFVEIVFRQLGEIQFFRDRLAHHLTRPDPEGKKEWFNRDLASVREFEAAEDIAFDAAAVEAAADDMITIVRRLEPLFSYCIRPDSQTPFGTERPTWRYKPSMLSRRRPASARKTKSQKTQRQR